MSVIQSWYLPPHFHPIASWLSMTLRHPVVQSKIKCLNNYSLNFWGKAKEVGLRHFKDTGCSSFLILEL